MNVKQTVIWILMGYVAAVVITLGLIVLPLFLVVRAFYLAADSNTMQRKLICVGKACDQTQQLLRR